MTATMPDQRSQQDLHADVSRRLESACPEVEVLLVQVAGSPRSPRLRVYIDHPQGVDHALCERVSEALGGLLGEYGLEVSSPGFDRPLTRPEHFQRFVGHRARVRTREPIGRQRNFAGEIVAADAEGVTLSGQVSGHAGVIDIPYASIGRARLAGPGGSP